MDGDKTPDSPLYSAMLELEQLESVRDEIEELDTAADLPSAMLPKDLRQRLDVFGIQDINQLEERIAHLHRQLDKADSDFEA